MFFIMRNFQMLQQPVYNKLYNGWTKIQHDTREPVPDKALILSDPALMASLPCLRPYGAIQICLLLLLLITQICLLLLLLLLTTDMHSDMRPTTSRNQKVFI